MKLFQAVKWAMTIGAAGPGFLDAVRCVCAGGAVRLGRHGKGNRNAGRDFDPAADNQKLDETKALILEQSRWSAYWAMRK